MRQKGFVRQKGLIRKDTRREWLVKGRKNSKEERIGKRLRLDRIVGKGLDW